ncbi:MAG: hypothetical protein ACI4MN_05345 [Candidatus Coproplasma sp.]
MEQKNETVQENFIEELIAGIDVTERTEWENETRYVSENIRSALAGQLDGLRSQCDTKFLDYCNCLKSLLTVYNFGNLASEEEIETEGGSESEAEKRRKITENDKKLMKEGVKKVLEHVKNRGYDLTPYLNVDDCLQIFGNSENTKTTIPVTLSAATVMTTLVYFRRLCKRKGLYSSEELGDLNDRVAETVAEILYLFAKVIVSNGYTGWGFTLDSKQSVAVTLNDTYAVVDAISRFDDAFNQDDKVKRDEEFLLKVSQAGEALGFAGLIDCCINAIFRTAFNTYQRDKDRVYGRSIFYTESVKRDRKVSYEYRPITIEQIASSNRSSALFNPLYVAMITMYGYNEKELVIRRFMDDYALAKQYYTQYEEDDDDDEDDAEKGLISAYAKRELSWLPKDYNFKEEAQLIINEHAPASSDYADNDTWKRYYNIARVFQKFVETQLPNDLMKIEEYRNYLNATKDAIDQVQIAYRKFDDSQRLGIVDTDYVMFSSLDINDDPVIISKLNKANISVNYLRPLLLSAKIMIVNALIKYPQSDMGNLYNAIKDSKHRKIVFKKRGEKGATQYEWLWNEDTLDMNSTARHCEAVMYDYFYYYEKYELSYNSLNNLKKYFGKLITAKRVNDDGSLNMEKMLADENMNNFRRVVLNLTRKNVEEVQLIYTQKLMEKDKQLEDYAIQRELERKEYEQKLAKLQENCRLQIEQERERHNAELAERQTSFEIGDAVRGWIRQEADRHLQDMLAHMILNNINGYQEAEDFQVSYMARGENSDEIVDGNFEIANELSKKIMQSYKTNRDEAERKYGDGFKSARKMQVLFEGALDDTLKSNVVKNVIRNDAMELSVKNDEVRKIYEKVHYDKRKNNETERKQNIEEPDETQKD